LAVDKVAATITRLTILAHPASLGRAERTALYTLRRTSSSLCVARQNKAVQTTMLEVVIGGRHVCESCVVFHWLMAELDRLSPIKRAFINLRAFIWLWTYSIVVVLG